LKGVIKTKTSLKRLIEDILRDYPNVEKYIHEREEELKYPTRDPDENVGGGKGGKISKPQEQMVITLDEDRRLNRLKQQRNVIDDCLDNADPDTRTIIYEMYFRKYPLFKMEGLITEGKIHCSRASAFQLRANFLKDVAQQLHLNVY